MTEWWHGAVLYQVYPRSFLDADGDGIGDIAGIETRLDYPADLGVDGVWICPMYRSPMRDFGYDVSSYREIEPIFGSVEDVDRLIASAHDRGLKIMLDVVPSHTSDAHPWFRESARNRTNPKADWYLWRDARPDGTPPNNWQSLFSGPAWTWSPVRRQYYYHAFLPDQPALNYQNPAVIEAMIGELQFWLDRGIDGFRLDAMQSAARDADLRDNPPKSSTDLSDRDSGYLRNTYRFQQHLFDSDVPEVRPLLRALRHLADRYPGTLMMGEIGAVPDQAATCARYTGDERLHTTYNFSLADLERFDAAAFIDIVRHTTACMGDRWMTWTVGNHDVQRVVTRWAGGLAEDDRDRFMLVVLACLTTLRGLFSLYQGDELGLSEVAVAFEDMQDPIGRRVFPAGTTRDGCRVPMPWQGDRAPFGFTESTPWLPMPAWFAERSVASQAIRPGSLLNNLRAFLRWRGAMDPIRHGEMALLDVPPPVMGIERSLGGRTLVGLFNLSNSPRELAMQEGWNPLALPIPTATWHDAMVRLGPFEMAFAERGAAVGA